MTRLLSAVCLLALLQPGVAGRAAGQSSEGEMDAFASRLSIPESGQSRVTVTCRATLIDGEGSILVVLAEEVEREGFMSYRLRRWEGGRVALRLGVPSIAPTTIGVDPGAPGGSATDSITITRSWNSPAVGFCGVDGGRIEGFTLEVDGVSVRSYRQEEQAFAVLEPADFRALSVQPGFAGFAVGASAEFLARGQFRLLLFAPDRFGTVSVQSPAGRVTSSAPVSLASTASGVWRVAFDWAAQTDLSSAILWWADIAVP